MNKEDSKKFGLMSIVLLGINGVIGSGLFLLPGKVMALVGPGSIFVYISLSIVVLSIGLCFAECAGKFSRYGAAYVHSVWLPTKATEEQLIWGLGALVVGVPLYFIMKFTVHPAKVT